MYGYDGLSENFSPEGLSFNNRAYGYDKKAVYSIFFDNYSLKSNLGEDSEVIPINVGTSVAVRNDWVQILD